MTFGAAGAAHGSYCLKDASPGDCTRPFRIGLTGRTSLDGHTSPFCGINETLTTCEAVNALVGDAPCPGGLDSECPEGGLCRTVGIAANRCTYECGLAVECTASGSPGGTCGRGTTSGPRYCGG